MTKHDDSGYQAAPESGLFYSPVFRAQTGKLPDLDIGTEVLIWFDGEWREAIVESKLPGQVYRVRFPRPINGCKRAILSCSNMGRTE